MQEKYFTSFTWEDIASVDYTVLAIPKHRIQYFKYKEVVIWDKTKRIDNVFGSLGSNITITDVVNDYEAKKLAAQEAEQNREENSDHADDDDEDDSDSDDGITVSTGTTTSAAMFMAEIGEPCDTETPVVVEEKDNQEKYWQDKLRPNHFVALRITDEDIQKTTGHIQDMILEHEPHFQPCCIPKTTLHLTLCTLGLDTPEQVANAVSVLKDLKSEIQNIVPKDKTIKLKGIEHFFNRVLYAEAECPQEFLDFVDHIKLCFKEKGIDIRDGHDFVPHMTIMKISRPVAKDTGKKYISPWYYSNKSDIDFGCQVVDNVYLCEMGVSRRDDGFYISPAEIHW